MGAAPAAHAATAGVSGGVLAYTAASGETNHLTVAVSSGSYLLTDSGLRVTPSAGCTSLATDKVTCPTTGVSSITIDVADGNDNVTLATATPTTVNGGSGNDTFNDGSVVGKDVFNGGTGGSDRVSYAGRQAPVTATLDGAANDGAAGEQDNIGLDVEQLEGGDAGDTLTGSSSANRLVGGYGNDTLNGGAGDDQLDGGPGADDLSGGAGTKDVADYSARTYPVIASIDGVADDGEAGENDNVRTDVEALWGGSANDRLTGGASADDLRGNDGDDWFRGMGGADTMSGGTGQDTVDYADRSTPVTVTDDGVANDGAAGENDNVGTDVDDIIGGSGDDRLTGSSWGQTIKGGPGDDVLNGNAGDDVLDGGSGDDVMNGGSGTDTADYSSRTTPVSVTIGDSAHADGAAGEDDEVAGDVEKLLGGSAGDNLVGDYHANTLMGGGGDDRLDGGKGADKLSGGDGFDTADYSSRTSNLTVDLDNSADDGESGERDNVKTDVEGVIGGSGNDKLTGGSGSERLVGGAGDDTLKGGTGADVMSGGDGRDTVDYSDRRNPVTVTLGGGADDGEAGEGDDVYADVETVKGGSGSDRLVGTDGPQTLIGNSGDDVLTGGGGADTLSGGSGSDTIDFSDRAAPVTVNLASNTDSDGDDFGDDIENATGGSGDDRLVGGSGANVLSGGPGFDTVDYSSRTAPVTVTLDGKADDGQAGENDNVLPDVEGVTGGSGDDKLSGSPGPDVLNGGPGKDTINGRGGVDRVDGGSGSDYLISNDGVKETVSCGSGSDGANADKKDKLVSCERHGKPAPPTDGSSPTPPKPSRVPGVDVHVVRSHGKIVSIPGFPGERVDRRLLPDIRWLRAKYHIAITDGYAPSGHAPSGEHPIGEAIDIVPGPGGSWNDIDRLAKFAEPRQNHPRAPWRWVGYNGDAGHGRGNHLHLSWSHGSARRGHPASWVEVLTGGRKPSPPGASAGNLRALAKASNQSRGGVPHVRSHLATVRPCSGSAPLARTWKTAARSFGLRWQILAGITQVESGLGCNMGPSSAGAIGWTQFMPATWKAWGMDANGDGKASAYNSVDAIFSTARYLRANGAPHNYRHAIYAYNHATWYVNLVLRTSRQFGKVTTAAAAPESLALRALPRVQTVAAEKGLPAPVQIPASADETLFEK